MGFLMTSPNSGRDTLDKKLFQEDCNLHSVPLKRLNTFFQMGGLKVTTHGA